MLKLDFHLHSSFDPYDRWVKHSPKDLIDRAAELDYDVLCFTHHGEVVWDNKWKEYAEKKGILLMPGVEAFIGIRHVLLINFTQEEADQCKSWDDLKKFKDENHLIIVAHPFFPGGASAGKRIYKHKDCYDAIEYNSFTVPWWDWNKKGIKAANELNKPLVANTDCHELWEFGRVYTEVDAEKTPQSVIKAIKENKVKLTTTPHSNKDFFYRTFSTVGLGLPRTIFYGLFKRKKYKRPSS